MICLFDWIMNFLLDYWFCMFLGNLRIFFEIVWVDEGILFCFWFFEIWVVEDDKISVEFIIVWFFDDFSCLYSFEEVGYFGEDWFYFFLGLNEFWGWLFWYLLSFWLGVLWVEVIDIVFFLFENWCIKLVYKLRLYEFMFFLVL